MTTKRINTAVWLEKYSRWQLKVQKDGERKTFTCSTPGRKGQIECNRKADMWLEDSSSRPMRVDELYSKWIAELKETTSKSHWTQYSMLGRLYLLPAIGSRKVAEIHEQHLQDIILRCAKQGASGKPLSHKTLGDLRTCISAFVKYCRKNAQTTLHTENLYIPKNARRGERIVLQPSSLKKLFSTSSTLYKGDVIEDVYVNAYRFEVVTGLRPGELLNLRLSDVTKTSITVKGSLNAHGEHTQGKNANARRTIALNDYAREIVDSQRKRIAKWKVRSEYLFCNPDGSQISQKRYRDNWMRYRSYNNMEEATPYGLRHTFASLIKSLPDDVLKSSMGHSYSFDTRATYTHELNGDLERNATMISGALERYMQ